MEYLKITFTFSDSDCTGIFIYAALHICVLQHARELEIRRREAEEKERRKQREVQMELERQLKEAEMVRKSLPNDNIYLQFL